MNASRWKVAVAVLMFSTVAVGSLVPSYFHLAGWYEQYVSADLGGAQHFIAALVGDAAILAVGFGWVLAPGLGKRRGWMLGLFTFGVAISIYANMQWAIAALPEAERVGLLSRLQNRTWDVLLGNASLPVITFLALRSMEVVVGAILGDDREARHEVAVTAAREARAPRKTSKPTAKRDKAALKKDTIAAVKAGTYGPVASRAKMAEELGVAESTVYRWGIKVENGYPAMI